jgi:hypothetical protein
MEVINIGCDYTFSNESKCDICGRTVNEIIILRKHRWSKNASRKLKENVHRVCLMCAIELNWRGEYWFGRYWAEFLLTRRMLTSKSGLRKTFKQKRKEVLNR